MSEATDQQSAPEWKRGLVFDEPFVVYTAEGIHEADAETWLRSFWGPEVDE